MAEPVVYGCAEGWLAADRRNCPCKWLRAWWRNRVRGYENPPQFRPCIDCPGLKRDELEQVAIEEVRRYLDDQAARARGRADG